MSTTIADAVTPGAGKQGRVSNWLGAGWGFGAMATATMLNAPTAALLYFLVTIVKLDPFAVGALIFAGKIIDVVTDPPVGSLSDRTQSRFGRRRPWLLGSSLVCGAVFALLFNVPELGIAATYLYVGIALALFAVAYTAFQVPYMAMPTEMTDDYHERTKIMAWRVVFMSVGNVAGGGGFAALAKTLGGDRAGYGEAAIYFGAFISVAMFATFLFTARSRQTTPVAGHDQISIRQHFDWMLVNRPVLKLDETSFFMVFLVQMVTTIAFMPVCNWLSKQIGKKAAYVLSLTGFCVMVTSWLLASPGEPTALLLTRAVLLGAFGAGAHLYGQSMLIDTFALDYRITGQRREGVLAAAFSFVEKLCMALAPFMVGALLATLGFDKDLDPSADQSDSAVLAIYLGFVGIPVVCQIASIFLLKFYHLTEHDLDSAAT
ncbi:MAG: MFS transporter [Gammaproteobacteria bacterium]